MQPWDNGHSDAAKLFVAFCREAQVDRLELGVYTYTPQTVTDRRRIVHVPVAGFDRSLARVRARLATGEDVAVHSRVRKTIAGQTRWLHVPMIDLRGDLSDESLQEIVQAAREFGAKRVAVFFSGRSFHVYAYTLLSTDKWGQFMGRCLLLNKPDQPELADSRWIGHRLLAGYASLRWTRQSAWYQGVPIFRAGFDVFSRSRNKRIGAGASLHRLEYVQPWLF
jgi:hypothetical protein